MVEGGSAENELWEMENCMCFHRVWVICGMGYHRVDCRRSVMVTHAAQINRHVDCRVTNDSYAAEQPGPSGPPYPQENEAQ